MSDLCFRIEEDFLKPALNSDAASETQMRAWVVDCKNETMLLAQAGKKSKIKTKGQGGYT